MSFCLLKRSSVLCSCIQVAMKTSCNIPLRASYKHMASRCQIPPPRSCDTFVALPPATANGCTVFGKNSDRPDLEVQEVVYQAAGDHEPGTKLQCTYIEIDQVPHTHAVILSKPAWMWGAEMGANDQGVCIGNEAVWTKLNSADDLTERLLGMDMVRLGLERGGSARESLDTITSLLWDHGQGGTCKDGAAWAYHNSFLIADHKEAWVLETAGKYWAAEHVTEGVRNISNQLTITTKMDLAFPGIVETATSEGLYNDKDGPFNFAKVFADSYEDPALSTRSRFCNGRRLLKDHSKNGTFGVQDMMRILRDEDSGINMDSGTTGSQVSVLPPPGSAPACHWFTATPDPAISMFKPFIFGPDPKIGTMTVSKDFGAEDPRIVQPRFQKVVDRRHDLFKGHMKLADLLESGNPKGKLILMKITGLETYCIADMEEIVNNYNENSVAKVSQMFDHMCNIENNFYK